MTQAQLPGMQQRPTGGEKEFFPTPPALCRAICRTLADWRPEPRIIIEPSAGTGNFVRAARAQWPNARIIAVDLVDTRAECLAAGADIFYQSDWPRLAALPGGLAADLILGNPPFSLTVPHVTAGLPLLLDSGHLAFLLRISIEEWTLKPPYPRRDFWPRYPLRARAPIAQRASFDGNGTDSTGHALFVWQKGFTGRGELLPPIDWKGT